MKRSVPALPSHQHCTPALAQLLITGGAGFIGSHTCLVLLESGHSVVVLDDFRNSSPKALERVIGLAGPKAAERLTVVRGDVRREQDVARAFEAAPGGQAITAVIHFAGLKAVGESVRQPLTYWDVNVGGSLALLTTMQIHGCRTIAFSSSATLYGCPQQEPIPEHATVKPINPYGQTKAAVEQMLANLATSEAGWRIARLRYFNPVGAHPSGQIGEDPAGVPNNLFPFISQVAVGRRAELLIYGADWPTPDGTGIRDYIHVMDLADGHRMAVEHLLALENDALITLNLGSGRGHSVLELLHCFEQCSGRSIPHRFVDRRPGDAGITVADPTLAFQCLGWKTQRGLKDICRDGWAWQRLNPEGYQN